MPQTNVTIAKKLARLDANEADEKSQNVILCANTPVICIRKLKSIKIDNGERFTIQNLSDVPEYSSMTREELRKCCDQKKLKVGGNKAELIERLQNAASDLVLKLDDDATSAVEVRVPRHLFQKHFRVAYAITYFQSQGCTLTSKYTIWDWDFYHVDWRAKNVAVSRATSKANIQIAEDERFKVVSETLEKVYTLIENRRNELPVADSTWESRLEKYNRLIKYMAESETFQLGSDGSPIWPAPPIAGEDERLITSLSLIHI